MARVSDDMGVVFEPGIYKIGWSILDAPLSSAMTTTPKWLAQFLGAINVPHNASQLPLCKVGSTSGLPTCKITEVYSTEAHAQTQHYSQWYLVTNTGPQTPPYLPDTNAFWDTDSGTYPDGVYKIKVVARDIKGNEDKTPNAEKQVVIDNALPAIQNVKLCYDPNCYKPVPKDASTHLWQPIAGSTVTFKVQLSEQMWQVSAGAGGNEVLPVGETGFDNSNTSLIKDSLWKGTATVPAQVGEQILDMAEIRQS